MTDIKFDPKKLKKLNNPQRLKDIPLKYIQNQLGMTAPKVMVDLGAGTAFFSLAFLRQFSPETIYSCDLSETMIAWIRDNVTPDHPGIVPVKSEETSVPLEDGTADLVFMIALHHELEAPGRTLEEAFRLLKPHGIVLIIDWAKKEMTEGPPQAIRCRPEEVRDQLLKTGFTEPRIHDGLPKHFMVTGLKPHGTA